MCLPTDHCDEHLYIQIYAKLNGMQQPQLKHENKLTLHDGKESKTKHYRVKKGKEKGSTKLFYEHDSLAFCWLNSIHFSH